jgi:hypothetical protein
MARVVFPFGDGSASRRIADGIEAWRRHPAPVQLVPAE